MSYTIQHKHVSQELSFSITREGRFKTAHCSASGTKAVRFPGSLKIIRSAFYTLGILIPSNVPGANPQDGRLSIVAWDVHAAHYRSGGCSFPIDSRESAPSCGAQKRSITCLVRPHAPRGVVVGSGRRCA